MWAEQAHVVAIKIQDIHTEGSEGRNPGEVVVTKRFRRPKLDPNYARTGTPWSLRCAKHMVVRHFAFGRVRGAPEDSRSVHHMMTVTQRVTKPRHGKL